MLRFYSILFYSIRFYSISILFYNFINWTNFSRFAAYVQYDWPHTTPVAPPLLSTPQHRPKETHLSPPCNTQEKHEIVVFHTFLTKR